MENIYEVLSKNLVRLRKNSKLTQIEFAEKVNYSDKSISKWEKGETVPNLEVLNNIAKYYGLTINDLLDENLIVENNKKEDFSTWKYNKTIISLLYISVVWILATIVYVYTSVLFSENLWLVFVYAVPMSCFLGLIFNRLWGNKKIAYVLLTIFVWSLLAVFYLQFLKYNMFVIFFLGVPVQLAITLWMKLKKRNN